MGQLQAVPIGDQYVIAGDVSPSYRSALPTYKGKVRLKREAGLLAIETITEAVGYGNSEREAIDQAAQAFVRDLTKDSHEIPNTILQEIFDGTKDLVSQVSSPDQN